MDASKPTSVKVHVCHGPCGRMLTKDDFSKKMPNSGNEKKCKACVKEAMEECSVNQPQRKKAKQ